MNDVEGFFCCFQRRKKIFMPLLFPYALHWWESHLVYHDLDEENLRRVILTHFLCYEYREISDLFDLYASNFSLWEIYMNSSLGIVSFDKSFVLKLHLLQFSVGFCWSKCLRNGRKWKKAFKVEWMRIAFKAYFNLVL